jgi:hypothetical protein
MRELDRVSNLIELLILCHPRGFSILLGESEPPTSREIHEMIDTQRVGMPLDFKATMKSTETEAERIIYDSEYFDKSVKIAGGWPHIHSVSNEFRNADTRMWSIVVDHVKFVGNALTRNTSQLTRVAHKYGISRNTVSRYRRGFSVKLGKMLLMPTTDNFYLTIRQTMSW